MRLALDHAALAAQADRASDARRGERSPRSPRRRLGREPVARILGTQRILGSAARASRRHAGAAAGNRNGGRGGARRARRRSRDARCASPISAPAPARCCWRCCANCRTARGVGTDSRSAALAVARDNARRARPCRARAFRRLRLRRGARAAASISWSRTRPISRAARSRGLRRKCATYDPRLALDGGATGWRPIARSPPTRGGSSRPAACWWSKSAPDRSTQSARSRLRRGSRRATAATRSRRGAARARRHGFDIGFEPPKIAGTGIRFDSSATQKSAWIIGRDRLGFRLRNRPECVSHDEPGATGSESHRRERRKPESRTSGSSFAVLGSRCFIG